jgi:hypothetical protein
MLFTQLLQQTTHKNLVAVTQSYCVYFEVTRELKNLRLQTAKWRSKRVRKHCLGSTCRLKHTTSVFRYKTRTYNETHMRYALSHIRLRQPRNEKNLSFKSLEMTYWQQSATRPTKRDRLGKWTEITCSVELLFYRENKTLNGGNEPNINYSQVSTSNSQKATNGMNCRPWHRQWLVLDLRLSQRCCLRLWLCKGVGVYVCARAFNGWQELVPSKTWTRQQWTTKGVNRYYRVLPSKFPTAFPENSQHVSLLETCFSHLPLNDSLYASF